MLATRQNTARPQCGSGLHEDYNLTLQVGGLVLILVVSILSCSFPLAVKRWKWLRAPKRVLFFCKHFGTGVILATCFVHLVPTAFANLQHPCLPAFWTGRFPAMTGLIIMLGCIVVCAFELFLANNEVAHTHTSEFTDPVQHTSQDSAIGMTATHARNGNDVEQQAEDAQKPDQRHQLMQIGLLEGGILFHSIFIGMAIAFSTGSGLTVLLIAISFHQMFEGLALGSRIAEIAAFSSSSRKPWIMALLYGITAPSGQAIGLAVHGRFDLQSQTGLLMVGMANAFSSGLLIYAGLVQLFYEDFMSEHSPLRRKENRKSRFVAYAAFVLGAVSMAIVGAWA